MKETTSVQTLSGETAGYVETHLGSGAALSLCGLLVSWAVPVPSLAPVSFNSSSSSNREGQVEICSHPSPFLAALVAEPGLWKLREYLSFKLHHTS